MRTLRFDNGGGGQMRNGFTILGLMALASCGVGNDEQSQNSAASSSSQSMADDANSSDKTQPTPSKYDVPDFSPSFLPRAAGHGNFEICLASEAKEDGYHSVTLPAGLVFQSWGRLTGPLTKSESYDLNTISGENKNGSSYAVLIENPVVVSLGRPCVMTHVKAVANEGFRFQHLNVPVELHLSFQADGLIETEGGYLENPEFKNKDLYSAVNGGVINGTPTADINDGVTLSDNPN